MYLHNFLKKKLCINKFYFTKKKKKKKKESKKVTKNSSI